MNKFVMQDMNPKFVKVIGERNSGTNYLEELIRENYDVHFLKGSMPRLLNIMFGFEFFRDLFFQKTEYQNLGWKHSMAPSRDFLDRVKVSEAVAFVAVAKNPYAWLLSMYKRPYHRQGKVFSFDEFISSPWPTVGRERYQHSFANPVEMWVKKNRSYIQMRDYANVICLSYESLLENTESSLQSIESKMKLKKLSNKLVNIERATKGDAKNFEFYKDCYLNQRWLSKFTPVQIEKINSQLDVAMMKAFRYEIISPDNAGLGGENE